MHNRPFSFKRFIFSSLGYFIIFSGLLSIFYFTDPHMLAYKFLVISSAIVALVLGIYHGKYKKQTEIDKALEEDIEHIEEEIQEEIEEISEKLHK